MPAELRAAAQRYFGTDGTLPTVDDVAAYYRERGLAAVVFTSTGSRAADPPIPNEEIAEAAAANADVLIPFASVDPSRTDAVERARTLIPITVSGDSSSTPTSRRSSRTTAARTRCTR